MMNLAVSVTLLWQCLTDIMVAACKSTIAMCSDFCELESSRIKPILNCICCDRVEIGTHGSMRALQASQASIYSR